MSITYDENLIGNVWIFPIFLPHSLIPVNMMGHGNQRKIKILLHSLNTMRLNEACTALSKMCVYFNCMNI